MLYHTQCRIVTTLLPPAHYICCLSLFQIKSILHSHLKTQDPSPFARPKFNAWHDFDSNSKSNQILPCIQTTLLSILIIVSLNGGTILARYQIVLLAKSYSQSALDITICTLCVFLNLFSCLIKLVLVKVTFLAANVNKKPDRFLNVDIFISPNNHNLVQTNFWSIWSILRIYIYFR